MTMKNVKNTSMQEKAQVRTKEESEFFFPEHQITVKATSIDDAIKKMKQLIKVK